jgi:DNA-dependent RNA polymerase auxiliary subunit epsilon
VGAPYFIAMDKDSFYFPHDYDPTGDPKVQALIGEFGATGYGIYWRIVEMLHSDCEHKLPLKKYIYSAIAKQMLTSVEQISTIIEYCIDTCELFNSDGAYITSNRVNRNINRRSQLSEKRSLAGKASAIARQVSTNVNKGKKRKGKKIEEDIIEFSFFWDPYHVITGILKSDKDSALKYWNKLKSDEQQKAIDNIQSYYDSLSDKKYCKKARTYLSDKNFNDEFIKKVIPIKQEKVYREGDLIPNPDWKEPQRLSNANR